jgi:membrane associated rhomboid family serine protease
VEFLKIVLSCILAAIIYGIAHDLITARICLEYFTVFHPPVFATQSPTLLAIGWGTIATWWAGAMVGLLLACAARIGPRSKIDVRALLPYILWLMCVMAASAALFGVIGYFRGVMPSFYADMIPTGEHRRFLADWWAHMASYDSGFVGGLALSILLVFKRLSIPQPSR